MVREHAGVTKGLLCVRVDYASVEDSDKCTARIARGNMQKLPERELLQHAASNGPPEPGTRRKLGTSAVKSWSFIHIYPCCVYVDSRNSRVKKIRFWDLNFLYGRVLYLSLRISSLLVHSCSLLVPPNGRS